MKRVAAVTGAFLLAGTTLFTSTAASQETTTTTDAPATTTTVADTTTTAAPATTTTAVPDTTTTTPAPDVTTTTAAPAPVEPVALPGQHVTAGSMLLDIRFADTPSSSCTKTLDLAGGQMNVARDDAGNIGGVYGMVPSGGGNAGLLMVGLGAVPAGVAILSVSDGDCEFDAIGIGSYASDGGWARINGIGVGLHPTYQSPDYVNMFLVDTKVNATEANAALDLQNVQNFLLRNRPGLTPESTTTTQPPVN